MGSLVRSAVVDAVGSSVGSLVGSAVGSEGARPRRHALLLRPSSEKAAEGVIFQMVLAS